MSKIKQLTNHITEFFHAPISPKPLGIFRILIASFALLQALFWYPDWMAFFGQEGWVQWEISQALNMNWHFHMEDLHHLLSGMGLSPTQTVMGFFWLYVASLLGLLVGWYTRVWAILSWVLHYVMMSTIATFVYGVDIFLHIAMFYLMVMPVAKAFSIDLLKGRISGNPDWGATLSIRVLQIHMCLVYLSAGYEKMMFMNWWEGNVLWRAMVQPDFSQMDMTFLAWVPWIPMLLSWFTMFVETFYFIGMWIKKVRVFWLLAMTGLHLGIGLFLGLWFFGFIMILLSVSAFGYDAWKDIRDWQEKGKLKGLDKFVQAVNKRLGRKKVYAPVQVVPLEEG